MDLRRAEIGPEIGPEIEYSVDQTLLSSERTYAGWVRTALTAVAVALGFTALLRDGDAALAAKAIATLFLALAVGMLIAADRRAATVCSRLRARHVEGASPRSLHLITWASVAAIAGLAAVLWLLA